MRPHTSQTSPTSPIIFIHDSPCFNFDFVLLLWVLIFRKKYQRWFERMINFGPLKPSWTSRGLRFEKIFQKRSVPSAIFDLLVALKRSVPSTKLTFWLLLFQPKFSPPYDAPTIPLTQNLTAEWHVQWLCLWLFESSWPVLWRLLSCWDWTVLLCFFLDDRKRMAGFWRVVL